MANRYLSVEYTDKQGKEVLLSQNGQNGGIMVSEKYNGDYQRVFSSFSGKHLGNEENLIKWYENDYQKLKELFADEFADEYLEKKGVKSNNKRTAHITER